MAKRRSASRRSSSRNRVGTGVAGLAYCAFSVVLDAHSCLGLRRIVNFDWQAGLALLDSFDSAFSGRGNFDIELLCEVLPPSKVACLIFVEIQEDRRSLHLAATICRLLRDECGALTISLV